MDDAISKFDPLYLNAIDEIYHSQWAARKKRRISLLRKAFHYFWPEGHPTRLIQITGTNGKGSVAHYLEQGFRFAGATGSWTGPHVFDYAERFHINGEVVARDEIVDIYRTVLTPYQSARTLENPDSALSFAELGILLSLHLFQRRQVRWGIMEVGAGGRNTPLMALPMDGCVLTNVGDDHPLSLGQELWQRALEKAGIARPGVPFFSAAEGEAAQYVARTARAESALFQELDTALLNQVAELSPAASPSFQIRNKTLALQVIRWFYPNSDAAELVAAMKAHLPARFECVAPGIIVDIAHNPNKVARLAEHLQLEFPGQSICFIIGLTRKRDVREVFRPLAPLAKRLVVTSASYAGRPPAELADLLRLDFSEVAVEPDPRKAFLMEKERLGENEVLVLTGSAYMIDQALNPDPYVRYTNAAYGWRGGQEP